MFKSSCIVMLMIGCGGKAADDCEKAFAKLKPFAKDMVGHEMSDEESKQQLATCREKTKDGKHDPLVDCALGAADDAALRSCLASRKVAPPPPVRPTPADPSAMLDKLGTSATTYFGSTGSYPHGKAATLPEGDCCKGPDGMCPVGGAAWSKDHVWDMLEFRLMGPSHYRYTYESTTLGSFTATAVGDPDCSGHEVIYKLDGNVENGKPKITLTPP